MLIIWGIKYENQRHAFAMVFFLVLVVGELLIEIDTCIPLTLEDNEFISGEPSTNNMQEIKSAPKNL